jgi:septum formation protein
VTGGAAGVRLILASASPARLATLRAAGLDPEVHVSGVDEHVPPGVATAELCARLATAKAYAVAGRLDGSEAWVIGCDSLLDLDGEVHGKPGTAAVAVQRWRRMRGRSGALHTGHCVVHTSAGGTAAGLTRVAATVVHFADVSDAEIEAYAATGEPVDVAGAFTLDGLGGAFVTRVEGDPHNVVGVSLPLLRDMFAEMGLAWLSVWPRPAADTAS